MSEQKDYTPEELAIKRRKLAQEYSRDKREIGFILRRKATDIIRIKSEVGTWKEAEYLWSATDDGQKFLELDFKCKGLIELIRSLKTEVDVKNNEAFGQY